MVLFLFLYALRLSIRFFKIVSCETILKNLVSSIRIENMLKYKLLLNKGTDKKGVNYEEAIYGEAPEFFE